MKRLRWPSLTVLVSLTPGLKKCSVLTDYVDPIVNLFAFGQADVVGDLQLVSIRRPLGKHLEIPQKCRPAAASSRRAHTQSTGSGPLTIALVCLWS